MVTLGSGTMLALEGGLVRFVRRSSGGVPRSTAGGGSASSTASQGAATRTPGAHVRVTFDRTDPPSLMVIPRTLTSSSKISHCMTFRGTGCAWRIALHVWTGPKTVAAL